ncbi:MAG: JAB domain-containing protein [bacterium]|nr:JAB domain-containing protein [bacterium]
MNHKQSLPQIDLTIMKEMEIRYKPSPELTRLDTPVKVWEFSQKLIGSCTEINFLVFYLNHDHQVNGYALVSKGSVNEAIALPREIFKGAIMANAEAIISCHNHPSGWLRPSDEDVMLTKRLEEAGEIVGIDLIDHFIVGEGGCFSVKEWVFVH